MCVWGGGGRGGGGRSGGCEPRIESNILKNRGGVEDGGGVQANVNKKLTLF